VPVCALTITSKTSNLSWNAHLNDIINRASKRIYFLIQMKRANVACDDLKTFYVAFH
jgi:hypothetical protein